ncbi:MAG TPA: glycosyltransferase family 9 protein [Hanamia sp.]|jgi:lipopolysaccharide heptosyltransferase II|nr:glycosyltransferase family 9 protein [Hanamia sp.]
MTDWTNCKNILVVRADNMGDLLMSSPAIRALKETFECRITLLTSAMGNLIAPFISEIDETIVADLPWIKTKRPVDQVNIFSLIEKLEKYKFDAAVIFTVYSQNPLPAAMLVYMAGIQKRLAYCRENPYHLLTDWKVEKEPYSFIQHQVKRDLELVEFVNAKTTDKHIKIHFAEKAKKNVLKKLSDKGVNLEKDWVIIHPGVSEEKREYPQNKWIETAKLLRDELRFQILITGSESEEELADNIQKGIGKNSFSLAGIFSVEEFIAIISMAPLVISVNTGTVHIAAATQTPVIVLYALTNPQHTPWQVSSKVLFYSVKENLRSKNEIVNYVTEQLMEKNLLAPDPFQVLKDAEKLLKMEEV